jgi:hypothetical protein
MTSWGFVWLAYGAAAVALAGYLVSLRGRLREAESALRALAGGSRR